MAIINDLVSQIEDKTLRERIQSEIIKMNDTKKFGLVFENHLPECIPLYSLPIKKGITVAKKGANIKDTFIVAKLTEGIATCVNKQTKEVIELSEDSIVRVSQFGEPIYPQLIPMDKVENAPANSMWHTLIEADNYHALQLLEYLYPKQVDCIYIDPPYNTGARDWKYNNDYVDSADSYRHSKWLSMMHRRLQIAKHLLKADGVLVIAIDQNELAHLVCLLEEKGMFSEYDMTIVSVVHNPRGNITTNFAETNEYAVYLTPRGIQALSRSVSDNESPRKLRRWGHYSLREERRSMFYPLYVKDGHIIKVGEQPADDFHPAGRNVKKENDIIEVWPIDQNGIERRWNYSHNEVSLQLERIVALPKDGGIDLFLTSELSPPKTVWSSPELDAGGAYGSSLVEKIVGAKFPFPKSLYTVARSIEPILRERKSALIVDFFAGSGTTLHAANLLNAEDGGNRRCILVTNNEVSDAEAKEMRERGLQPGQQEWETHGICQSITWPRSKYSIKGKRDDGSLLDGECLTVLSHEKTVNRRFIQIGFSSYEDLDSLSKKKQLVSLLGKEKLAQSTVVIDSRYIVSEQYPASILFDDTAVEEWITAASEHDNIREFYIVTKNSHLFNNAKKRIQEELGDYSVQEFIKRPLSDGFQANAEYFKLGFLDKSSVELGMSFNAILPMLWLQSGAVGKRPTIDVDDLPEMLIPENSSFAVLIDESAFSRFKNEVTGKHNIKYVYLATDSQTAFREMSSQLKNPYVKQLYRDYIDNFTINTRRNSI